MKRMISGAIALMIVAVTPAMAQSLDDLNIQIHGYATQGFLYTTNNNIFTTHSSDGSPAWTEAVINISSQPTPKLRIAAQGHYFLLGNYGNNITLDWGMLDYKFNDKLGMRFGKVKTPIGLFNEIQDVDPSYLWALLPQSIYPITSRASILAHYGTVVYGTFKLDPKFGKIEYRGFGGEGVYANNDGYFVDQAEAGFELPNDIRGPLYGGALHWRTPLPGLMIGASDITDNRWSATYQANNGNQTGTYTLTKNSQPNYFAQYDKDKIMIAYEYSRNWGNELSQFPGTPVASQRNDDRGWYVMASYKLTAKLNAGAYHSENVDRQAPLGPARYQKEWVVSGRYDFNEFLYAKAEEHYIQGTGLGYDTTLNPNPQTNTNLTVLKIGASF
jgi:hypothetical protein